MKILFTADIHIKLGQKNVPVEWAKNRYNLLWSALSKLQAKCDLFVIGGDVFDKLPNMEELECYFSMVSCCSIPTIIYSGNHEAVRKNTTFLTNLKQVTNRLNSKVQIIDDFYSVDNLDFIPYNKLKEYSPQYIDMHGDVLFTHVRGSIPPHVQPEVDLNLFSRWHTVLAGDLHSYENSQLNILYPGSPVTTSFHRNLVDTGVIIFDNVSMEHTWHKLEVPQLIRKTVGVNDPKPPTTYHHTIYQVEGDMQELVQLEDSELIDRKVLRRDQDTKLILDSEMTLQDELGEYLRYILQLPDNTIERALLELQNHLTKITEQ